MVRYCHGCEQYDDAPRVFSVSEIGDPAQDKLYHYDCAPASVVSDPVLDPILSAVNSGTKNADLAEVATEHAKTIEEEGPNE